MRLVYSDIFPEILEADTLYVSREYNTTAHLCVSGCGLRVVLPLGKGSWELLDETKATLHPSVHVPSCNSHYWIEDGGIRWENQMSDQGSKDYSRTDQELYNQQIKRPSLFERLILRLKKFMFGAPRDR